MSGTIKIFLMELEILLFRPYLYLWLLIVPLCFIYVAGNSATTPRATRIVLQQVPEAEPSTGDILSIIKEYSKLEVSHLKADDAIPVVAMDKAEADIGIFWTSGWYIIARPRTTEGRASLLDLANRISIALSIGEPVEIRMLETLITEYNTGDPSSRFEHTAVVDLGTTNTNKDIYLIPRMIALISTFLPFLLGANSIAKDMENNSISTILVAPGVGWWQFISGKILCCLFVSTTLFVTLILSSITIFDVSIYYGFINAFGLQFLAILTSTMLGLAISGGVTSQFQGYLVAAAYLFCLLFLTGLLFPLEHATPYVQLASFLFPMTFSFKPLEQSMLIGLLAWPFQAETLWLFGQCIISTFLALGSLKIARNRL